MSNTIYEICEARSDEQLVKCFELLNLLRPHLEKSDFVKRVRAQEAEGYKMIYIADDEGVKSVAGYRTGHFLAWGKILMVDDLITLPEARGIGFGTHLLKWLKGEAKRIGCDGIHLDTGIDQADSHRLYLNLGLKIDCLHLSMNLD